MADYSNNLGMIKKALVSIGFSLEEAEQQINEVGKLVTMAILRRLLQEKTAIEELTPQNIQKYLNENFTANYLKQVVQIESNNIVEDYLKAVTRNLTDEAKTDFFEGIE